MPGATKNKEKYPYVPYINTIVDSASLERYKVKINLCDGIDPYQFKFLDKHVDISLYPAVTEDDINNYYIIKRGLLDNRERNCEKGKRGYEFYDIGFVRSKIYVMPVTDGLKSIIFGKVTRSQTISDWQTAWALTYTDGRIITTHCTCAAGLGEVCSHASAVLYYVAHVVQRRQISATVGEDAAACTSKLCQWIIPPALTTEYKEIGQIDFTTPRARKAARDKQTAADEAAAVAVVAAAAQGRVEPPAASGEISPELESPSTAPTRPRHHKQASAADPRLFDQFLKKLFDTNDNPALLIHHPQYFLHYEVKLPCLPPSYSELFDECLLKMNFLHILPLCQQKALIFNINKEKKSAIEQLTREGPNCDAWFSQKAGLITGTSMYTACRTDPYHPSMYFVKKVCYPKSMPFKSKECLYGIEQEEIALEFYAKFVKETKIHQNFSCTTSGLQRSIEHPHIAATPDAVLVCTCCGVGVSEVKSPYKAKDCSIQEYSTFNTTCLISVPIKNENSFIINKEKYPYEVKKGSGFTINPKHEYYYQIQTQLRVVDGAEYCDFIIWSGKEVYIERIEPDLSLQEKMIEKSTFIFKNVILPELCAKYFTHEFSEQLDSTGTRSWYCYCEGPLENFMLLCKNDNCSRKQFHYKCVGLNPALQYKSWQCMECNRKEYWNACKSSKKSKK